MLVIPRGTTSELPLIGITNPVNWNSQLVGNFDMISESLGITKIQNYQSLEFSTETPNANPGMG